MPIKVLSPKDDMFNSGCDGLVNTVNCLGVMGGGIAAIFKKLYPAMFKDYAKDCRTGEYSLGTTRCWEVLDDGPVTVIFNTATKFDYTKDSTLEGVRMAAFTLARKIVKMDQEIGVNKIAIPALGCGLGGLDFDEVLPILLEELQFVEDYLENENAGLAEDEQTTIEMLIFPPR